jgi:putative ABC transport system permease protein
MAIAIAQLVASALLLRTVAAARALDVGFDASGVLTAETSLPAEGYPDDSSRRIFQDRLLERLAAIPGVQRASLIKGMPFAGDAEFLQIRAPGSTQDWDRIRADYAPPVSEGYFDLMGIPLVAGRTFDRVDGPGAERVVVVSRNLAERLYPGADPVGRRVETPEGQARIIGVVGNTRRAISSSFHPTAYVHSLQAPPSFFSVMLRTDGAPGNYRRAAQEALWSVDPRRPLWEIMSLGERMSEATRSHRFLSLLLSVSAGLSLFLAAVGLYAVMAHSVSQRRRELGVRIALGADSGRVLRMVLGNALRLSVIAALVGVAGAAVLARLMSSMLFGVEAFDPVSFGTAAAVLVFVALLAAGVPALRATRIQAMEAMRD